MRPPTNRSRGPTAQQFRLLAARRIGRLARRMALGVGVVRAAATVTGAEGWVSQRGRRERAEQRTRGQRDRHPLAERAHTDLLGGIWPKSDHLRATNRGARPRVASKTLRDSDFLRFQMSLPSG